MIRRVLRWIVRDFAAVAVVVVFVGLGAFAASEAVFRWPHAKPPVTMTAATDPDSVARGRRLATVAGCHDCHGGDFSGKLFHDEPAIVRAWAPNLTLVTAQHTDAELDRAIRHGVGVDGRALWVMPSEAFAQLSDAETADLIAYLRTFKAKGAQQPALQVGPVGRVGLLLGKFESAPAALEKVGDRRPVDLGPQFAVGRSLSRACVECHGADLKGGGPTGAPDLTVAGAYEPEDFERLMRTGVAAGGRKLGLMTQIAPPRFNALSHEEIGALHAYLKARAEKAS
jgi:mono/diheme cytochrome c family protein